VNLRDSPEQARFRSEVRAWLAANLPPGWGTPGFREPQSGEERVAFGCAWQRKLFDGGFAGLEWPQAFGGRGATAIEALIFGEESARVRAPRPIQLAVGIDLVGPTLIACGSEAQKVRHLAPILCGDEIWCQAFSEPNAGSDIASLRTRGDVQDDAIVVTGQKIWTSFAQHAQWCILVVRSDPQSQRHRGLTFLLVDVRSPGITVRPLRELTGDAWFNEVFFDAVRVPIANVVGTLHRGWDVVMTTLAHERGSSAGFARLAATLAQLCALARRTPSATGLCNAAQDPRIRDRLASYWTQVAVLRMTAYRSASALEAGAAPGPEGSTLKLAWSELEQRVFDTAIEITGLAGLVAEGDAAALDAGFWSRELLWSRAATIYAGTSEVQRNILAQRVLGLPRAR
jgi:alkylation response protein AidB-like acyl-CoA dehydrogenase